MRRELGIFFAVLVMCGFLFWCNHDFGKAANILNVSRQAAMLGIFAIGSSFVIITGGIDLSVGAIIGLTGVLIAKISSPSEHCLHHPLWVGIIIAMAVALSIGLIQGLLISKLKLQPFIVTLAGMLLVRGLAQIITHGGTLGLGTSPLINLSTEGLFHYGYHAILAYPVLIFIGVILLAGYLLHGTVFGRYVFAIGGNRDAAQYSGIPVDRVETLTYVISAGLAGVAGICYASYIGQMTYNVGNGYELNAIAAAVIGGVSLRGGEGSVPGAIIGSIMMEVIQNGIILFKWVYYTAGQRHVFRLSSNWTYFITGAVILLAVLIDQLANILNKRKRLKRQAHIAASKQPPPAPLASS